MGKYQWSAWARNQGLGAGFFIFTGGVISFFYPNMIWAIVNTVTGLIIMGLEYPVTPFSKLGFLSENYYFRAFLYLAFIAPTIFQAPTTTGGMCLATTALTYLRAGVNGESGAKKRVERKKEDMSAIKAPPQ
ncbi:hypothetical protein BJ742DRAFT_738097 [Cladochytrium replicatum]|nr:hypothetical protein BJ742DRAFT_738097 [Cladochytrium replicatum]